MKQSGSPRLNPSNHAVRSRSLRQYIAAKGDPNATSGTGARWCQLDLLVDSRTQDMRIWEEICEEICEECMLQLFDSRATSINRCSSPRWDLYGCVKSVQGNSTLDHADGMQCHPSSFNMQEAGQRPKIERFESRRH